MPPECPETASWPGRGVSSGLGARSPAREIRGPILYEPTPPREQVPAPTGRLDVVSDKRERRLDDLPGMGRLLGCPVAERRGGPRAAPPRSRSRLNSRSYPLGGRAIWVRRENRHRFRAHNGKPTPMRSGARLLRFAAVLLVGRYLWEGRGYIRSEIPSLSGVRNDAARGSASATARMSAYTTIRWPLSHTTLF